MLIYIEKNKQHKLTVSTSKMVYFTTLDKESAIDGLTLCMIRGLRESTLQSIKRNVKKL